MRVSSNQMSNNYLRQLNNAYGRQQKLMEKTDGSDIHRPSDNPVNCVRTMLFNSSLVQNEQFTSNLNDAVSWMKSTDSAMSQIADQLKTITERVSQSANSYQSASDMKATANEVTEIINQIVSVANGQLGDRYIFSGQSDKIRPYSSDSNGAITTTVENKIDLYSLDEEQKRKFGTEKLVIMTGSDGNTYYANPSNGEVYEKSYVTSQTKDKTPAEASIGNLTGGLFDATGTGRPFDHINTDGQYVGTGTTSIPYTDTVGGITLALSTSTKTVVKYNGDLNKISMPVQNGGAKPESDSVNMTGADLFGTDIFGGQGSSLLNDLFEIRDKISAGDVHWLSETGITLANNSHDYVINKESEIGGRLSSYEMTKSIFEDNNTVITGDISSVSDAKVDEVITDLQMAEIVYRLSLSVGSKILPPSLADYL